MQKHTISYGSRKHSMCSLLIVVLWMASLGCTAQSVERLSSESLDLARMMQPIPTSAAFRDLGYYVWCGTMVQSDDGKYHLYYSRWKASLGMEAWVTSSEVAHAIGDAPTGPFKFHDVALPPRSKELWDGMVTHNPTVIHIGEQYYLYYMGNTGDGKLSSTLNWVHRNNQRIGVAISKDPNGPGNESIIPLSIPVVNPQPRTPCAYPTQV